MTRSGELVTDRSVTSDWLAAVIRNSVEQDDLLREQGAIVVQLPNDPTAICVFQRGGVHLMVQVFSVDVVIQ